MTTEQIIALASSGYPDGLINQYFKDPKEPHGDGLAAFLACELQEVVDPNDSDTDQLLAAIDALEKAQAEISGVIHALDVALDVNEYRKNE